jgi:predicted ribosome-associated RNA-binding protein Tma20
MFKKEFNVTQSYTLSNKEKKDILKKLKNLDNGLYIDHILSKFSPMTLEKTNLNKMRVLRFENNPLFFEYSENQFLPTIYLLNMFPSIIKKVCLIYDDTDSYLENGADLMLKGVLNRVEIKKNNFHLNEVFSVITTNG